VTAGDARRDRRRDRTKRLLDVTVASTALVATAPLLALAAAAVAVDLGRPVLFRQVRAGRHGRPFTLAKLRTMRDVDPTRGLVTDAERLTRLGRLLRSTSVDELPGLVAVLRGHLSLVGPRPLPVRYLDRYSPEQARRHDVRPGVTGLAQVSGRNGLDWPERLALDVRYVDTRSTRLDLSVLLRTVGVVLGRRGTAQTGQATSTEFRPSPPTADVLQEPR
jgi:lipopolysaccharide/colanic/teichoic acid biosynthesis glycosyltransferase